MYFSVYLTGEKDFISWKITEKTAFLEICFMFKPSTFLALVNQSFGWKTQLTLLKYLDIFILKNTCFWNYLEILKHAVAAKGLTAQVMDPTQNLYTFIKTLCLKSKHDKSYVPPFPLQYKSGALALVGMDVLGDSVSCCCTFTWLKSKTKNFCYDKKSKIVKFMISRSESIRFKALFFILHHLSF